MNTREREVMDALANALRQAEIDLDFQGIGDETANRAALAAYDALPAEGSASSEGAEAVAYVPVHPRNGPLWANTTPEPNAERLPSYPLMRLYTRPQPAQGEHEQRITVADVARLIECKVADVIKAGYEHCSFFGPANQEVSAEDAVLLARWTLHEQRSSEGSEQPGKTLTWLVEHWRTRANACREHAERIGEGHSVYMELLRDAAQYEQCAGQVERCQPERRPIADEVVSPHAETQRKVALGPQPDYYTAEQTEFLESALPRGLPAGSDAEANDNEVCEGCKPDCQYRCGACPVPSTASKTHAEQSSGSDARVTDAKVVPYGSASGEKDYAYGYEKGYADGWNAAIRAAKQRTIAAQQRRGGEK